MIIIINFFGWIIFITILDFLRGYTDGWKKNYLIPLFIIISILAHHFLVAYYFLIYKQQLIYILLDSILWFFFFNEFRYKTYDWNEKLILIIFIIHFLGFVFYSANILLVFFLFY